MGPSVRYPTYVVLVIAITQLRLLNTVNVRFG